MCIEKEFLAYESGLDSDSCMSDNADYQLDDLVLDIKRKIINDIEIVFSENKNSFINVVLDIKSGHFDFPPESIFTCIDILFDEIKRKINQ